ncbi:ATP-binding protein [uncultured Thiohalocapsa sp.]|uniref:ATP-binding protein n=1 Tax=uncultured Thiohalocapsa sp. TaxID=768990 RepID=UPI00345D97E0
MLHRLPAWHVNLRKQLVKAPKLHFFDSGLLCHLLGVRDAEQLRVHPLRGAVFESWVFAELFKLLVHRGEPPSLFHYRETRGAEIDLLLERGLALTAVEVKSAATVATDFFNALERFSDRMASAEPAREVSSYIVYGGEQSQRRSRGQVLGWRDVGALTQP